MVGGWIFVTQTWRKLLREVVGVAYGGFSIALLCPQGAMKTSLIAQNRIPKALRPDHLNGAMDCVCLVPFDGWFIVVLACVIHLWEMAFCRERF